MMSYESSAGLRQRLIQLIPLGLLVTLATVNLLYWVVRIAPQWSSYEQVQTDLLRAQEALTQTAVQFTVDNNFDVVQLQLTHTAEKLNTAAQEFLTQSQADTLVMHLYDYARTSGVVITLLQNQPSQADTTLPYTIQMFHVQINGGVPQLLNFIARIEEVTRSGFVINEVAITNAAGIATMSLTLQLYILPNVADYTLSAPLMTITPIATATLYDAQQMALTSSLDAVSTQLSGTALPPSATITETVVLTSTSQPTENPTQTPWIIMQTAQSQPPQPQSNQQPVSQIVVVTQVQIEQVQVRVVVTATPSFTPTPTITLTPSETPTLTPSATPTITLAPSETPTLMPSATESETPTLTPATSL